MITTQALTNQEHNQNNSTFPGLPPVVNMFPTLATGYMFPTLVTGYMFPALDTGCMLIASLHIRNHSVNILNKLILSPLSTGTIWMNWCMFGACAGCIPILLGFHKNYRRLDIDKENSSKELKTQRKVDKNPKRLKSPIGSILSFTHVDELVHKLKKAKESNI